MHATVISVLQGTALISPTACGLFSQMPHLTFAPLPKSQLYPSTLFWGDKWKTQQQGKAVLQGQKSPSWVQKAQGKGCRENVWMFGWSEPHFVWMQAHSKEGSFLHWLGGQGPQSILPTTASFFTYHEQLLFCISSSSLVQCHPELVQPILVPAALLVQTGRPGKSSGPWEHLLFNEHVSDRGQLQFKHSTALPAPSPGAVCALGLPQKEVVVSRVPLSAGCVSSARLCARLTTLPSLLSAWPLSQQPALWARKTCWRPHKKYSPSVLISCLQRHPGMCFQASV